MFDIDLTYDKLPEEAVIDDYKIIHRVAVRGIIYDNDKLLMVQTKHGDYKFPGGGVGEGETYEQALLREIREETGYSDVTVCCMIGRAFEQNIDWFEDNAYFQMESLYYICRLNSDTLCDDDQEEYEKALGYRAVKLDAEEAFETNEELRYRALAGKEKLDSTTWPRELDGLDREFQVLSVVKDMVVGKIIAQIFDCGQTIKYADRSNVVVSEKEGKANFVTSYDKSIQEQIKERLLNVFPNAVFVGEEEDIHESIEKGYAFIVDPIDGTTNFMKDYHMSCISVGMTYNGELLAGVVYNPYLEEVYYARKGRGAFCNGKRINVSNEAIDNGIVLFGTAPYYPEMKEKTFKLAMDYYDRALDLRRSGSAALDMCAIAAGRAEVFFECVLCPWDFAAGTLLVREAGGCVTTLEGEEITLEKRCSLLATNGVAR